MQPEASEPPYLSVNEVVLLLQSILDQMVPPLYFNAEISEVTRASSGHLYLTLKDAQSQLSAVMWRGNARSLSFIPERGLSVQCVGKPSIYAANGRLQIVLSHMTPAGEGVLRKRFLELKARLEKEGLFREERKRQLPFLPRAIGIVTSKSGAVIHDMMVKFRERMPQIPLYLVDVRVQGEGAALEVAAAIEYLSQSETVDLIIVARGGGSLEDLWAFNEEVVVRAIFSSRVPVISGVGHEVDVTLADYVADVRAPTPTAAAEMAVPHRGDLLRRISDLDARLRNVDRWLLPLAQRVDEIDLQLRRRVSARVENARLAYTMRMSLLERIRPIVLIEKYQSGIALFAQRLASATRRIIELRRSRLESRALQLESLSPRRVLERGYSIVERDGVVVRDARVLTRGDEIAIRLSQGVIQSTVDEILLEGES